MSEPDLQQKAKPFLQIKTCTYDGKMAYLIVDLGRAVIVAQLINQELLKQKIKKSISVF